MILHTVAFRLREGANLFDFLEHATALKDLPGVGEFEVLEQIGQKNEFTHALSMHFENQAAYDAYNAHPDHQAFVETVWLPKVEEFIELDYRSF